MAWIQISLTAGSQQQAEAVEHALLSAGALSVTLRGRESPDVLEPGPGQTPLWDCMQVIGLFPASTDADDIHTRLQLLLGVHEIHDYQVEILEERDWSREWLKYFKPIAFGKRLWVCPSGQSPPQTDAVNLILDPGLAFGTGTHPTTALCLQWLDGQDLNAKQVLDYGCGSGILAIAALLLGAAQAVGVDTDPQALLASRENAHKNQVAAHLQTLFPEQLSDAGFDVVMANILARPLLQLAPTLARCTRPGGHLILSGLLCEQAQALMQAYAPWFEFIGQTEREDWICLEAVRQSATVD